MIMIDQSVNILNHPNLTELKLIEYAGRTCYNSHDKITNESYDKFINRLIKSGHHSVLEHSLYTIKMTTSRAMMAELTRHRICSFSIESQRFVNYDNLKIIKPFNYDNWPYAAKVSYSAAINSIQNCYDDLQNHAIHRQIARGILCEDIATNIVMSCNMRELMHIIKLRTSKAAHPQMQCLMGKLKQQLDNHGPFIWKNIEAK
jgi:thymidylate synthase (FAD)